MPRSPPHVPGDNPEPALTPGRCPRARPGPGRLPRHTERGSAGGLGDTSHVTREARVGVAASYEPLVSNYRARPGGMQRQSSGKSSGVSGCSRAGANANSIVRPLAARGDSPHHAGPRVRPQERDGSAIPKANWSSDLQPRAALCRGV